MQEFLDSKIPKLNRKTCNDTLLLYLAIFNLHMIQLHTSNLDKTCLLFKLYI